jgi:S-adenosylmethionine/arginine decarboxylase-like enzyme
MDGLHFILDAKNVVTGHDVLTDENLLSDFIVELCNRVGLTPLDEKPHIYKLEAPPDSHFVDGYTGVFVLKESHITFHTFSEVAGFALDIFSCKKFLQGDALKFIDETFGRESDFIVVSFERKL